MPVKRGVSQGDDGCSAGTALVAGVILIALAIYAFYGAFAQTDSGPERVLGSCVTYPVEKYYSKVCSGVGKIVGQAPVYTGPRRYIVEASTVDTLKGCFESRDFNSTDLNEIVCKE